MEKLQIRDLTQEVEIFWRNEDGSEGSRAFVLREHSRDDLDRFIDLQIEAGKTVEKRARETELTEDNAVDITRLSIHLTHDSFYEVAAFCLREPKDGGDPPDASWCQQYVARRKAEAVIRAQENLDGLDDPEKKAEAIRALMIASHQARRITSAGSLSTIGSPRDTD